MMYVLQNERMHLGSHIVQNLVEGRQIIPYALLQTAELNLQPHDIVTLSSSRGLQKQTEPPRTACELPKASGSPT